MFFAIANIGNGIVIVPDYSGMRYKRIILLERESNYHTIMLFYFGAKNLYYPKIHMYL